MKLNWSAYAIEACGLATFMIAAGAVAVALHSLPASMQAWLDLHPIIGRAIFGSAMAMTVIAIVYSPLGARSGAHLNPAMTATFAWLGKVTRHDAVCYVLAQFLGSAIGFSIIAAIARSSLLGPPNYGIVTKPGMLGAIVAFASELAIAFVLMTTVLHVSNARPSIARFTGVAAAVLVATFITFEAPLSGMSMNPARTFASALLERDWTDVWVYFTAPPLGMLIAAFVYVRIKGAHRVLCAKLNHAGDYPCIFNCSANRIVQ